MPEPDFKMPTIYTSNGIYPDAILDGRPSVMPARIGSGTFSQPTALDKLLLGGRVSDAAKSMTLKSPIDPFANSTDFVTGTLGSAGRTPGYVPSINTATTDGAAGFFAGLSNLTAGVLASMGERDSGGGGVQVVPVSGGASGNAIDPVILVGGGLALLAFAYFAFK